MRISMLLENEPIGLYIENALKLFFDEKLKKTHSVKWIFTSKIKKTAELFYCNNYLNSIFRSDARTAVFNVVKNEYSRSVSIFKRPFQYLYVFVSTIYLTRKYFSHPALVISPVPQGSEWFLIMGGNSHIRVNDYSDSVSYVISKNPFCDEFVNKEMNLRFKFDWLPVPKIKKVSEGKKWFAEELINGTPVNRLGDLKIINKIKTECFNTLLKLYAETSEAVLTATYCDQINRTINGIFTSLELKDTRIPIDCFLVIEKIVSEIKSSDVKEIKIALTHGDFQAANMLKVEEGFKIIDWEYVENRFAAYDLLTFFLEARSGINRIVCKAIDFLSGKMVIPYLNSIQSMDSINQRKCALRIFLLEDLMLKLSVNKNPELKNRETSIRSHVAMCSTLNDMITEYT